MFAESWHADWSFEEQPPIGPCLPGMTIPPAGGDTRFANQHMAYKNMPEELQERIAGLSAIHSAVAAYSPDGLYGKPFDPRWDLDTAPCGQSQLIEAVGPGSIAMRRGFSLSR